MGYYQLFILSSVGVLTFIVVFLSLISKKKFSPMQGMVISMFFGMNTGLTIGVLLGGTFQGNLFLSTIVSMAIGMLAGLLCGICFTILSMLEGLMAGLMGGMMGAMLGEMVIEEQLIDLIRIFLLLSITTIFLFVLFQQPKNQKTKNNLWLLKPILLATSILIFIVVEDSLAKKQIGSIFKEFSQSHSNHSVNMKGNTEQVISIQAEKMKYSLSNIEVKKDQQVTLILENLDPVEHDIEFNTTFYETKNGSQHKNHSNKDFIHLHAQPQTSSKQSFVMTKSGIYEYYCTIAGHKELGIVGRVIVK
ncbi:plastocyanin/azurin family copper-binding protein [Psychrobacillus vulpis]|uniref:Copper-binding protein n=1 Tax=Psychrobacillus vulpis TaxID=2325572 RepID=A0A544TTH2_9BACI|nr:plastocyanin/azurin family copper-binding protein [Psychrobacillus vulpis]TQR20772.1 copper-binding protein [Psychrobacillus vulpis]